MFSETAHYLNMIDDLRQQVISLITDLPAEALNWRPLPQNAEHATNSLAVMAAHVAGAEHFWMTEVIGGFPPTRDRAAEFVTQADGADDLLQRLREVGAETCEILTSLSADDLAGARVAHGQDVPVRWAILHVIDHTALHLGHMQITYQLWMGGQSKDMPRWFERLPRTQP